MEKKYFPIGQGLFKNLQDDINEALKAQVPVNSDTGVGWLSSYWAEEAIEVLNPENGKPTGQIWMPVPTIEPYKSIVEGELTPGQINQLEKIDGTSPNAKFRDAPDIPPPVVAGISSPTPRP